MNPDWQDTDPDAYDPENPLALLEKAAAAGEAERAMAAVRAVRCMTAAGADAGVMAVARDFAKRSKILAVASFDQLVTEARGDDPGEADPDRKSAATILVEQAQELYSFGVSDTGRTVRRAERRAEGRGHAPRRQDIPAGPPGPRVLHPHGQGPPPSRR